MQAEIIALGTELTTGQKLDTNSQWLSVQLGRIGIPVHLHTTVADGLEPMIELFQAAAGRSDYVFITGGLGPTLDDLTREAMAGVVQRPLVEHAESLRTIRDMFERRGREMPARNAVQAQFPAGSQPLANPRGTAPGIWLPVEPPVVERTSYLIALPGVPSEMKPMFAEQVLPRLPGGQRVIRIARINCFGAGESQIEQMLGDLTARGRDPEVGITAHEATITLRIAAHGVSDAECEQKIDQARQQIRATLGHLVFGEEDETLEQIVLNLLRSRHQTLATVEIGGAGVLANRFGLADPGGSVFRGGLQLPAGARWPDALVGDGGTQELVSPGSAADSKSLLQAAAESCRAQFGVDHVLGRWIPAEDSVVPEQSARVIHLGPHTCRSISIAAIGDITIHNSRAAKVAQNLLRQDLLNISPEGAS